MRLALFLTVFFLLHKSVSAADFQTWADLRDRHVIKQEYDFSCGVAAVATLINFQFDGNVTETSIIKIFLQHAAQEDIKEVLKKGFSLRQLRDLGQYMGFDVSLVRFPDRQIVDLKRAGRPALVYIEDNDYRHFVVYRGEHNGTVFIADPSVGNRKLNFSRFLRAWKGNFALYIHRDGDSPQGRLRVTETDIVRPELRATRSILSSR